MTFDVPPPSSRTSNEVAVLLVTYKPLQSPFGTGNTLYSISVLTVWMKSRSSATTAEPLTNCPVPASSNQFLGDSMADNATLRAPPSIGTTACLAPVQFRLPLLSMLQPG